MKKLAAALLFILAFSASCSDCDVRTQVDLHDKEVKKLNERIIGGEAYNGMPAVVALTRNGRAHCTATIVSPVRAITAHHCVYKVDLKTLKIVFSPDILDSSATRINVIAAKSHPRAVLSPTEITNDVAYLTLESAAPVSPMIMRQSDVLIGEKLFLVGYGVDNGESQSGAGRKRAAWSHVTEVTHDKIFYGGGTTNTCNGDSGGPAFTRAQDGTYEIAGITSYGDYSCSRYGADMRVDFYYNFLSEEIGSIGNPELDPCDGYTNEPTCVEDVLYFCENSVLRRKDCKSVWGDFGSCADGKCLIFGFWEQDYE